MAFQILVNTLSAMSFALACLFRLNRPLPSSVVKYGVFSASQHDHVLLPPVTASLAEPQMHQTFWSEERASRRDGDETNVGWSIGVNIDD